MVTFLGRIILVITSFAPVALILALVYLEKCKYITAVLLLAMFILWLTCKMLMGYIVRTGEKFPLKICEFNRKDKGTLAFLLIYILPIVRSPDSFSSIKWYVFLVAFAIIAFTIVDTGAYSCNLIVRLCGYHFFEIKDEKGIACLLLATKPILRLDEEITMTEISRDVFVQVES